MRLPLRFPMTHLNLQQWAITTFSPPGATVAATRFRRKTADILRDKFSKTPQFVVSQEVHSKNPEPETMETPEFPTDTLKRASKQVVLTPDS